MAASVLIIMGSDSDYPVMQAALKALADFGLEADIRICSAHRSPALAAELAAGARQKGYQVILAAAGLAAHLPGVLAAWTSLPVIGIPVSAGPLAGQDALLAIVQMPPGVPVATMAIDGAVNAAILAVQILATADQDLARQLDDYKTRLRAAVTKKQVELEKRLAAEQKM